MMRRLLIWFTVLAVLLVLYFSVCASEITPIGHYSFESDPDMPQTLIVGKTLDCGNYSIRLLQQPVLSKYSYHLIADNDLEYLIIRMAITNKSDRPLAWLNAESFNVIETYKGTLYSTYKLDIPASAAAAEGVHQPLFFEKVDPGDTMYTSLVFSVYPDVDGWVFRFAPRAYYEEYPAEVISFLLPVVNRNL